MGGIFGGSKAPAVPAAPVIPPAAPPAVPPGGSSGEVSKLKRKKGDKANLMTGGMGLAGIATENLGIFTLGGKSNTGLNG